VVRRRRHSMKDRAKLVAIVDDDESMRKALMGLMKASGFPAQSFASAEEFLNSNQVHQTGCLILDIRMPGMSGLELQARLNFEGIQIPTIFITAHGDGDTLQRALSVGAMEFLTKPFDDDVLLRSVRAALEH
jgi:FixJ family two-component response regulator